jgi:hypothetical protein
MQPLIRKLWRDLRRQSGKRDQDVDQRSSCFAIHCSISQCCCNHEFFELMSVGGFSPSTKQSWFALLDFRLFQRWKSTSEVSASTPLNMFKMKSRTGYVPSTHFCVWRTWQIDMSLWYMSKQTLWLCGVVKLIWDCIWAPSITLYVVILCE